MFVGFIEAQANCATGAVATPIIDSISVDIAGNVTICWQDLVDPDIDFYVVVMIDGSSAFVNLDTVYAPVNCFTMPAVSNNSDTESVEYFIRAYDNCIPLPNASALDVSSFHGTMHLDTVPNVCFSSLRLDWTPYDDFTSGVNVQYDVYVSENSGPYTIAGTVFAPDTSFNYVGINQGTNYNFFIRATENNGAGPYTSSSNDVTINGIDFLKEPKSTYLYTATVVDSFQIDLSFYVDTAADISRYDVKRATSINGSYATIGSIAAYVGMPEWLQYSDFSDINANNTFYFYRVEAINICGIPTDTSNVGRTVWLKVKADGINATNRLTVTQYDGWLGNVQSYDIYRSVAGVWEGSPIASISPFNETTTYVDDITTVFEGDGEYCYKIIANEGAVIHTGGGSLPATSISNESCTWHEPLIYVPNAFVPLGIENNEFKPVLTFADPEAYLFQIYNKWGQKIFETKEVNEAWNGRMNNTGNMSQSDSYVYVIQFVSASNDEHSKRGVVTLLH